MICETGTLRHGFRCAPAQRAPPAPGSDLRTDLPLYRVYRDGLFAEARTNVTDVWTDDLVAVLLGCSFTFELALAEELPPCWYRCVSSLGV